MRTWKELFTPITDLGWDLREGQEIGGNEVIRAIEQRGTVILEAPTGSGKSLIGAIPAINAIKNAKASQRTVPRTVISTESINLQSQLVDKDLPFLHDTYGGFSFSKLMGRANYLCFNQAYKNAPGNPEVSAILERLEKHRGTMITGEYQDVVSALKTDVPKDLWGMLTGSSDFCGSSDCKEEECYSALARKRALQVDIVVVNHSLLAVNHEILSGPNGAESGGILGPYDILIVDECHALESVLASQWTETMSEWEIKDHTARILSGLASATGHYKPSGTTPSIRKTDDLFDNLSKFFDTSIRFFSELAEKFGQKWDGSETAFCLHGLNKPSPRLLTLMEQYEEIGPALMDTLSHETELLEDYFMKALVKMIDGAASKKEKKDVRKALTSVKWLKNLSKILRKALDTTTGVISHGGTTYGVIFDGWTSRKSNERTGKIRCVPVDVSRDSAEMWSHSKSNIFMSATLTDLTSGDFEYFKKSLGVSNAREVKVRTSFDYLNQQLTYVTAQQYDIVDDMSYFSVEEIVDLVNTAKGRSLILFTSRRELEVAKNALLEKKVAGLFPYTMYVQESDSDKGKLVNDFTSDTYSVLLGLKSMFTGINIPGESLSLVIMCRFPLPRFSTETKMKMVYWRGRGFHNWYEREALTVFQQASGRLIRSKDCIGAVALIDQRAYDSGSKVFKTAFTGIQSLGSRVTHNLGDVSNHLQGVGVVAV